MDTEAIQDISVSSFIKIHVVTMCRVKSFASLISYSYFNSTCVCVAVQPDCIHLLSTCYPFVNHSTSQPRSVEFFLRV